MSALPPKADICKRDQHALCQKRTLGVPRSLLDFRSCLHQIASGRATLQSPGLPKAFRPSTAPQPACRAETWEMLDLSRVFVG